MKVSASSEVVKTKPSRVIPLTVLLLMKLSIKSRHHVQTCALNSSKFTQLCEFNLSLQKCAKHTSLQQSLKTSQLSCLINVTSEQVYLTEKESRRKKTNLLQAWWIWFSKARQHLLTFKHMSSTIDFFGKTGKLMSRFAGGLCFGVKLQAAFSASFL